MNIRCFSENKKYQTNCFPNNFKIPPRIGETVVVVECFHSYFQTKNLPIFLTVKNVIWSETEILIEL